MDIGDSIIIGSFVSLMGMIIILQLNTRNWFKKENFKMQKTNIMNENRLKLRKLEKDMGLQKSKITTGEGGVNGIIGEVISNYVKDKGGDTGGLGGLIGDFLEDNPEVVKSFIEGFTNKDGNSSNQNTRLFEH